MYKIEKTASGYLLTFTGFVSKDELHEWLDETKTFLEKEKAFSFGVVVDMRTLVPLSPEAQPLILKGLELFRAKGMKRSAVILNNDDTVMQFKRHAKESSVYQWERYIPAKTSGWSDLAISWVRDGVDPDKLGRLVSSNLLGAYRLGKKRSLTVLRQI